ncbi:hypothetical protein GCM10023189_10430 [Nibrella saemangeumensis]|uniref:DUF4384 domain-containing protein n=1 Tax=Nibrella saemangeumensis TaxID=1084526 RepID=A0ABP8MG80_9BACT
MKFLRILPLLLMSVNTMAQAPLTDTQKRLAALVISQTIADFQMNLSSLLGQPAADIDPQDRETLRMQLASQVHPEARFENDLAPQRTGSPTIDFTEYIKRANLVDYPNGLQVFAINTKDARFETKVLYTPNGYLMAVYTTKELEGLYKGDRPYRRKHPCRIGVYFAVEGSKVRNCRIGFIDSQPAQQGSTFTLTSENPLDYVTLEETLEQLAKQLSASLPKSAAQPIHIETLSYDGKGVINEFAQQVTASLRNQLRRLNPALRLETSSQSWAKEVVAVKGTYRQEGDLLTFSAQVYNSSRQPTGPAATASIQLSNLTGQVWKPDEEAMAVASEVRQIVSSGITVLPNPKRLQFDLSTNRGAANPLYLADDTMKVFMRASQPCYVRLIYQDAESNLLLLRNEDIVIQPNQTGQWIELPENYICYGPPFGPEFLIGYASSVPFEKLNTEREVLGKNAQGGEEYITHIKDNLAIIKKISTTHTLKTTDGSVVEKMIQVTTRKR